MSPLDAAWESVLSAPDDDQALLVLADALMERGDPHGELIRLQLAKPLDPEAINRHLAAHAADLLGDPLHLSSWSPEFSRGFLARVELATTADLEAVISRPIGRLLRQLLISSLMTDPIEAMVGVLGARGPRTIDTLRFGRGGLTPEHPGELEIAPLTSRLTSLKTLTLTSWALRFEGAVSPSLRELQVNFRDPVHGLGDARFPGLAKLELELPFRRLDFPLELLAGEVAPKLTTLTISGSLWPQQLGELAVSALLRGLTELEIAAEAETGWYPTLLETIDSFAHLERLEIRSDRHHPEWVAAVKAALPRARIRDPQLRL